MIKITVVYATEKKQIDIPVTVDESCTVELAIVRSKILEQFPEIKLSSIVVGIFGQRIKLDNNVQVGDRVEIYRPLLIDPKELRRIKAISLPTTTPS